MTTAYRCFTNDLRSPGQGGEPVWDGHLPFDLPTVDLDMSDTGCASGWHACAKPEDALRISGLWPDGRPSRLYRVETDGLVLTRGNKCRAATWRIVEEIVDVRPSVSALHAPFGDLAADVTSEVLLWRESLARPERDVAAVEAGLRAALTARGLNWELRRYDWAAWNARDAEDAWNAWDARGALTVYVAARKGWTQCDPLLLTTGLRNAYRAGLASAAPVSGGVLGYVMEAR